MLKTSMGKVLAQRWEPTESLSSTDTPPASLLLHSASLKTQGR